jgi:hypothetical protein
MLIPTAESGCDGETYRKESKAFRRSLHQKVSRELSRSRYLRRSAAGNSWAPEGSVAIDPGQLGTSDRLRNSAHQTADKKAQLNGFLGIGVGTGARTGGRPRPRWASSFAQFALQSCFPGFTGLQLARRETPGGPARCVPSATGDQQPVLVKNQRCGDWDRGWRGWAAGVEEGGRGALMLGFP